MLSNWKAKRSSDNSNLFTDVVAGNANQVQDGVHVPRVVHCVLLSQNGNFQHLQEQNLLSPQTQQHVLWLEDRTRNREALGLNSG